jgi:hypothetical protein
MDPRPARGVVLCLTKHLAGYWRDIPMVGQRRDSPDQFWVASSELAFCEQFIGQLRLLEHDQTIRDSGDVCGARDTQSNKNFSVSSSVRRWLRTTGEIA